MNNPLRLFFGAGGAGQFRPQAASFDGASYLTRGGTLTGAADNPDGIFSVWFKLNANDNIAMAILDSPNTGLGVNEIWIGRTADNKITMSAVNSSGTATMIYNSSTTYLAGSNWHHLLMAWRWRTSRVTQIYVDDTNVFGVDITNAGGDNNISYQADKSIGRSYGSSPGGVNFNGCLAEVYFAPAQYLDISVVSNRRKFISASSHPVNIGSDGSLPTGVAPLIYFSGATFSTNKGTGGAFTTTGTLTACATKP